MDTVIVYYLIAITLVTFCVYGLDKWKAQHGRWRVPEVTLLLLAAIGGSLGAWAGMRLWHHKTLHKKFKYGIPAIIIIQIAVAAYLLGGA